MTGYEYFSVTVETPAVDIHGDPPAARLRATQMEHGADISTECNQFAKQGWEFDSILFRHEMASSMHGLASEVLLRRPTKR